jgi:RimJ/RimL family protein N-acetyltransferase
MMDDKPYFYDEVKVNIDYDRKINDPTRKYFAIYDDNNLVGQIYLKNIDYNNKSAEFGIALINDLVKNKGIGSYAIRLLIDYSFNTLKLDTILANTVIRNTRSQHVLEKVGFKKLFIDTSFIYYELKKVTC